MSEECILNEAYHYNDDLSENFLQNDSYYDGLKTYDKDIASNYHHFVFFFKPNNYLIKYDIFLSKKTYDKILSLKKSENKIIKNNKIIGRGNNKNYIIIRYNRKDSVIYRITLNDILGSYNKLTLFGVDLPKTLKQLYNRKQKDDTDKTVNEFYKEQGKNKNDFIELNGKTYLFDNRSHGMFTVYENGKPTKERVSIQEIVKLINEKRIDKKSKQTFNDIMESIKEYKKKNINKNNNFLNILNIDREDDENESTLNFNDDEDVTGIINTDKPNPFFYTGSKKNVDDKIDNFKTEYADKLNVLTELFKDSDEDDSNTTNESENTKVGGIHKWKQKEIAITKAVEKINPSMSASNEGRDPNKSDVKVVTEDGQEFYIESKLDYKTALYLKFRLQMDDKGNMKYKKDESVGTVLNDFIKNYKNNNSEFESAKDNFIRNMDKLTKLCESIDEISESFELDLTKVGYPDKIKIVVSIFDYLIIQWSIQYRHILNMIFKRILQGKNKKEFKDLIEQLNILDNKFKDMFGSSNITSIKNMTFKKKFELIYKKILGKRDIEDLNEKTDRTNMTLFKITSEDENLSKYIGVYYGEKHNCAYMEVGNDIYIFNDENDPMNLLSMEAVKDKIINYDKMQFIYTVSVNITNGKDLSLQIEMHEPVKKINCEGKNIQKTISFEEIAKNKSKNTNEDEELMEHIFQILNENNQKIKEGISTSETAANKFEVDVSKKISDFFSKQKSPYDTLKVEHYEGTDNKYWSDISITNPNNNNRVWIEAKENKYANLGSTSWKYVDGEWNCTTLDDDDPLLPLLKKAIEENGQKFIEFCKDYLKKDEIKLPTDLSEDLIEAWKKSGNIEDTDNDVQFITNKIQIEDFGSKIADYYKNAKNEPVYYIQVGDELYIIDRNYNVFNFKTKDGKELKSLSEAYRIGRIQFRAKGLQKEQKYYYSIYCDVKILADKDNVDKDYFCSFMTEADWPIIDDGNSNTDNKIKKDDDRTEIMEHIESVLNDRPIIKDKCGFRGTNDIAFRKFAEINIDGNRKNRISLIECMKVFESSEYLEEGMIKTYPTQKFIELLTKRIYKMFKLDGYIMSVNSDDGDYFEYDGKQIGNEQSENDDMLFAQVNQRNVKDGIAGRLTYTIEIPYVDTDKQTLKDNLKNIAQDCYYMGYNIVSYDFEYNGQLSFVFESKFGEKLTDYVEKLYHISPSRNDEKILKRGIFPKSISMNNGMKMEHPDRVYVFSFVNENVIKNFCRALGKDQSYSLFEIDVNKLNNVKFFVDNMFEYYKGERPIAYYTYDTITPKAIKKIRNIELDSVDEDNCDRTEIMEHIESVIKEEKKEFHLKDKDQTYKPEQNKYAFKNRTDSYGGDDYITTNDIVDRVDKRTSSKFGGHNWFKGSDMLDSHNSYIYAKIDDGKDTTLAIKDIVKSEKNPRIVYVQTTDGEGMKSVDFGSKLSDMMYFLGRTIKGYLVIMNKSDESVYICNKIEAKDNDVILSFEWGDLVDFSEELKENQNKQFMKTDVSESVIKDILDNSRIENKRFDRSQFSKYFGLKEINWCVLYENEEPMAIAAVQNDCPFKDYYYIDEIQNLRKGYGKPLIEEIINKYHKVWLMANTAAGDTLIDYYRGLGLEEIRVDDSVYECTAYFFCSKECDYDKLENYCIVYYANDKEDEINEDVVDDTIADMKKVKSTNKENSDTKKTMNHTSSKTLTLIVVLDGRLKLIDADGYSMRRDDGGEMYFDDSNDAKEWAEERGYEVDDSIEREGLQENKIGNEEEQIIPLPSDEIRIGLIIKEGNHHGIKNNFLTNILNGNKKVETRKIKQWNKIERILKGDDGKAVIGQSIALMSNKKSINAIAEITDIIHYKDKDDFISQYDGENAHMVNSDDEKFGWQGEGKVGIKLNVVKVFNPPKIIEYISDYENQNDILNGYMSNRERLNSEAEKDIGGEKSDIADELQGMKIWIDDVREAPEGFKWFKTVNDFIDWCYRKQDLSDVALIDTDHDAGEMQEFGGDYIVCFKYLSACNCKNLTIHIHSANPVGANNIRHIIHQNKENGWKEIRNG